MKASRVSTQSSFNSVGLEFMGYLAGSGNTGTVVYHYEGDAPLHRIPCQAESGAHWRWQRVEPFEVKRLTILPQDCVRCGYRIPPYPLVHLAR